jgi:hypothetical protein
MVGRQLGRLGRSMRLPLDHHAGQGAGDAVNDLDAGDHQPAQLIQTGGLNPGDDVVGSGKVFGQLHTIQVAKYASMEVRAWSASG